MPRDYLKIVSYNIHKGFNVSHREFILPQMREALREIDPDFIFLQEVQGKHKKRNLKKIEKHAGHNGGKGIEKNISADAIRSFGKTLGKNIEKSIGKSIEKNISPHLIKTFGKNIGEKLEKKLQRKLERMRAEEKREALSEQEDPDVPKIPESPEGQAVQEGQASHKLQEIQDIPQAEFLAQDEWSNYIYGKNAVYGPAQHAAHHGNALLSKFPFSMWDNINVALSKRASRSLLHGVVELPDTQLHVICIHLGLFTVERKIQLSVLSDRIKEHIPDDAPLIIAGDFNDWQGRAENHLETELALKEVFKVLHGDHAKTFPAVRPAFRVDRIYYRGLRLRKTEVLDGLPWKKLSDHLPLYAELVLD